MFIAMNRFRIAAGREQDFESVWRNRQSYLAEVPGFVEFHLLRGPAEYVRFSTRHIQCGRVGRRLRIGPTRNRFEKRTARLALQREHTSGHRSSKVSMSSFK
jgi:antibiotic biosynthesis monooxygenase